MIVSIIHFDSMLKKQTFLYFHWFHINYYRLDFLMKFDLTIFILIIIFPSYQLLLIFDTILKFFNHMLLFLFFKKKNIFNYLNKHWLFKMTWFLFIKSIINRFFLCISPWYSVKPFVLIVWKDYTYMIDRWIRNKRNVRRIWCYIMKTCSSLNR